MRGGSSELERMGMTVPPLSSVQLVSGAQSVFSCSVCAVSVKSSVSCTREASSAYPAAGCAGWVDQLSLVCGLCTTCRWWRAFYVTVHRKHDGNSVRRLAVFVVIAPLTVNIFDYLLAFNQ